jgi:hypothetical protein
MEYFNTIGAQDPTMLNITERAISDYWSPAAALGRSPSVPLSVTTAFTMKAGSSMWFFKGNITNDETLSYSDVLLVNAGHETLFVPVHLESPFAEGWSKLPPELKLFIVEKNESTLGKSRAIAKCARVFGEICPRDRSNLGMLYHHLRMTPEIAALTKQIFYDSNGFNLSVTIIYGDLALFPAVVPGYLVQWIELNITLGIDKQWTLMHAVHEQSAALLTFQYVQVTIFLGEEYRHAVSTRGNLINYWLEEHSAKYVRFRCAGELAFAKPTNHAGYLKIPEAIQRRIETILSFRITFKEREDPSNEL